MNDQYQFQQAEEFRLGSELGRSTADADELAGRYDLAAAAARYREVNAIPVGLDLHADFASARAGFISGYRSLADARGPGAA